MSDPVKLTVIPGIKSDTAASPGPVPNAKDVADAGAVLPQVDASLTDSSPIATNPAVSRDGVDQAVTVGTPEMHSEAVNAEGTQKAVQSIDGSGLTVGQHLAAVRSALGLSIEHIADQLKLSPRQIDAIETGNYAALPDLATVRGFIRAYARMVRLDTDVIMKKLPGEMANLPPKEVSRPLLDAPFSEGGGMPWLGRQHSSTNLLMGSLFFVALFVLVIFLYRMDVLHAVQNVWPHSTGSGSEVVAAKGEAVLPVAAADMATTPSAAPSAAALAAPSAAPAPSGTVSEPVMSPLAPAPAAPPAPVNEQKVAAPLPSAAQPVAAPAPVDAAPAPVAALAAAPAEVAANTNSMVFKFKEDSWLQIKRPDGRIVFGRLVKAGGEESITVDGPMSVVVGNARGVEASLRGQSLTLKVAPGGNVSYLNIK